MRFGAAAWMTTFALVVGGAAVGIDAGMARVLRAQLQTGLDAAALSATQVLDGTEAGIAAARLVASDYTSRNLVLLSPLDPEGSGIEIGTWSEDRATLVPWHVGGDPRAVDAVRITHAFPPTGLTLATFGPTAAWFRVEAAGLARRAGDETRP